MGIAASHLEKRISLHSAPDLTTMSEDDRKLFVGGISWDTTEEGLNEYFSQYGQLESVKLITDRETGRSKGFAFIVFYDQSEMNAVLDQETHEIDGRSVTPRKATPGGGGRGGGGGGRGRGGGGYGGGRGGGGYGGGGGGGYRQGGGGYGGGGGGGYQGGQGGGYGGGGGGW